MTETTQSRSATNGVSPDGDEEPDEQSSEDMAPSDRLKGAAQTLLRAVTDKAVGAALDKVEGLTDRLTDVAESGGVGLSSALGGGAAALQGENPVTGALKAGASSIKDKVTGALGIGGGDSDGDSDEDSDEDSEGGGGSSGSGRGKFKFMNITEQIDVGVPLRVAYDAWTQFGEFSGFMKKVESVNQESDEKQSWKAQVFWSHRTWEATIREQVPDSHIIWVSSGAKGHADGCVSFHELAPNMTRILLVMEYYPQGFFEKTANLWRAVGRRTRLEFKHFARHVTMDTLINRDELEGWRGEIRDSEVVKTHEEAMEEEQARAEEGEESEEPDEYGEYGDAEESEDDLADEDLEDADLADEDLEGADDLDDEDLDDEDLDEDDVVEDSDDVDDEDMDDMDDVDDVDDEPEDADEGSSDQERPRRRSRQRAPA